MTDDVQTPQLDALLLEFLPGWANDPTGDPRNWLPHYRDLLGWAMEDLETPWYEDEPPEQGRRRLAFVEAFTAWWTSGPPGNEDEPTMVVIHEIHALKMEHGRQLMEAARKLSRQRWGVLPPSPQCN
jgi:hypothetical protein